MSWIQNYWGLEHELYKQTLELCSFSYGSNVSTTTWVQTPFLKNWKETNPLSKYSFYLLSLSSYFFPAFSFNFAEVYRCYYGFFLFFIFPCSSFTNDFRPYVSSSFGRSSSALHFPLPHSFTFYLYLDNSSLLSDLIGLDSFGLEGYLDKEMKITKAMINNIANVLFIFL